VEIEFNEFARGKDEITVVDFARLIFRYTTIKYDDQSEYIRRVNERMSEDEQVFDFFARLSIHLTTV
jgi:hypothetical protein